MSAVGHPWPRLRGREGPPPDQLRLEADGLSATFEAGALRWIELDGQEVLRGVYGAVRDVAWNTVEPTIRDIVMRSARGLAVVEFLAEHVTEGIDFRWHGRIRLEAPGSVTFEMDGRAGSPCLVARVGICVLQPPSLAGRGLEADTVQGRRLSRFPDAIEPSRWLTDIERLRWEAERGVTATLSMSGDRFEIEDQRNWTDGSYKLFNRPLRLPWPYRLEAGEAVHQVAHLGLTGRARSVRTPTIRAAVRLERTERPMPALGTSLPRDGSTLTAREIALLGPLGSAHLRVVLDLGAPDWPARLAIGRSEASALGARLEIEAIEGDRECWERLAAAIRADRASVARILVFGHQGYDTPETTLAAARHALAVPDGLDERPIGGGSRENFAELNRAEGSPAAFDVVVFPVCPQVHALDEDTMLETIPIQGDLVRRAAELGSGRPVAVGPVTLRPLVPSTGAAARMSWPDPRQMSLFAAGWLAGSIAVLAATGVSAATYFDAVGLAGLVDRSDPGEEHWLEAGAQFPAFHVFRALARGTIHRDVRIEGDHLLACAVRHGSQVTVVVANASPATRTINLSLPGLTEAHLSLADERVYQAMTREPDWIERAAAPMHGDIDRYELVLPRYAMAFVSGSLNDDSGQSASGAPPLRSGEAARHVADPGD